MWQLRPFLWWARQRRSRGRPKGSCRAVQRVPTIRSATKSAIPRSVFVVLDQGICSLSNFLTGVVVAKALSPEVFGQYSLFMSALIALSGLQNALITGPMRVLGICADAEQARKFVGAQIWLQIGLSTLLAALSMVVLALRPPESLTVPSFVIALFGLQFQELLRIINLTQLQTGKLLLLDILTHGIRLSVLGVLYAAGLVSPAVALLVIGISAAMGLFVYRAGFRAVRSDSQSLKNIGARNWAYGRWLVLEAIAFSVSTQAHLYLTATLVDTAAVGGLMAVQVLMQGFNVFAVGLREYLIPVARRCLVEEGYYAWRRKLVEVGLVLAIGSTAYGVFTILFGKSLLALLYSSEYESYSNLFSFAAMQCIFLSVSGALLVGFRTALAPIVGLVAQVFSAVVTLVTSYSLIAAWGVTGAAIGLVLSPASWMLIYVGYILAGALDRRCVSTRRQA